MIEHKPIPRADWETIIHYNHIIAHCAANIEEKHRSYLQEVEINVQRLITATHAIVKVIADIDKAMAKVEKANIKKVGETVAELVDRYSDETKQPDS